MFLFIWFVIKMFLKNYFNSIDMYQIGFYWIIFKCKLLSAKINLRSLWNLITFEVHKMFLVYDAFINIIVRFVPHMPIEKNRACSRIQHSQTLSSSHIIDYSLYSIVARTARTFFYWLLREGREVCVRAHLINTIFHISHAAAAIFVLIVNIKQS